MTWLCDDFVEKVKRKAWLASTSTNFTDQNILDIAHEQANTELMPFVRKLDKSYYSTYEDIPLSTVDKKYRIPSRAATQTIINASLINSNGQSFKIRRVDPFSMYQLEAKSDTMPSYFCIDGSYIKVWPTPVSSNYSLRVLYQRRIPSLVVPSSSMLISSIQSDGSYAVMSSAHSWAGGSSFKVDIMYDQPNGDLIAQSVKANAVSPFTTRVYFDDNLSSNIVDEINDSMDYENIYLCEADTSPVIPFVDSVCFVLRDFTAAAIMREQMKNDRADSLLVKAKESLPNIFDQMVNRVNERPYTMKSGGSLLR